MIPLLFLFFAATPTGQDRQAATCTAELRSFVTPPERLQAVSRSLAKDAVVEIGLSTAVSNPSGFCLPNQIVARATYFDANNRFVCSGSVLASLQREHTQVTLLEIRPWRTQEFVLWKNGPPGSLPSQLLCRDTAGAVVLEPWQSRTIRLQLTALPKSGGVASIEFSMQLDTPEQ